jgi:hypothetical protein
MQRWKRYMASAEVDQQCTEALQAREPQFPAPEPLEADFIGPPWVRVPDYEPLPCAT